MVNVIHYKRAFSFLDCFSLVKLWSLPLFVFFVLSTLMSSTQASYPRSPLVDAFTPLLNSNASGGATPSSSSTRGGSGPIPNEMTSVPAKSCSSSLRPPSSTGTSKPTSASARASTLQQRNARPLSEVIRPENFMSPESKLFSPLYSFYCGFYY